LRKPIFFSTLLLTAALVLGPDNALAQGEPVSQQVHAALGTGRGMALSELGALRRFYGLRQDQPAWFDQHGLNRDGRVALAVIADATSDGLDPARYSLSASGAPASRDIAFTADLLRYVSELRSGRDDWRHIDRDVDLPPQLFDAGALLAQAVGEHRVGEFLQSMKPQWPGYDALRAAYAQYNTRVGPSWPALTAARAFDVQTATEPQRAMLRMRLAAEDPAFAAAGDKASDEALDAALRRYQQRNGLATDGRIGPATLAALNVPLNLRRAQIAANMERMRWLPHAPDAAYVLVNVPDASLELWSGGEVVLDSRVIVGKPLTRTPMFRAEITGVIANPPWSVPISIARKEMLPKLRRNPLYLAKNHIVVQNGPPGDPYGNSINWHDPSSARYLPQLQQLPGDDNALGEIKLNVSDRFSVYLHDTPSRSLFARDNRFLSHGCIRVQQIGKLANFILNGRLDDGDKMLTDAIAAATTRSLPVKTRLPVYVLYYTAFVDRAGVLQFRNDIYGRDSRLIPAMIGTRFALAPGPSGFCSRPA
jgi:murein L,D-transpeptidase YcbB/YkuD